MKVAKIRKPKFTRREFAKKAAYTIAGTSCFLFAGNAFAEQPILRIAQWNHLLPEFDTWFDDYARQWGRQNGISVIVDHLPASEIRARANAEVAAGKGHDLFMFPASPATYQRHVIDHRDIYSAVSRKHGNVVELAHKSTFNPKSQRYFAFAESFIPAPLLYLSDCWAAVGLPLGPSSYAEVLATGARIRATRGLSCGLSLAPNLEGNVTLLGLLWSFGSSIVDSYGSAVLNSPRTVGALRLAKQLYRGTGSLDVLASRTGDHEMLSGKISCTVDAISQLRIAEKENPELAKRIMLSPPMHGLAARRLAAPRAISCYVIWDFAKNKEPAQRFLIDMVDASATAFEKSRYCNFPCFPSTVPNLIKRLSEDPIANPAFKYRELEDALHWTQNIGYPGYDTPVMGEIFDSSLIPKMFASVVKGESTPEAAARDADLEVRSLLRKSSAA